MTIKKLEARVCSRRLEVFEVDQERKYLGFVNLEEHFEDHDLKNTALLLYSRTAHYLKRVPKFEINIVHEKYG